MKSTMDAGCALQSARSVCLFGRIPFYTGIKMWDWVSMLDCQSSSRKGEASLRDHGRLEFRRGLLLPHQFFSIKETVSSKTSWIYFFVNYLFPFLGHHIFSKTMNPWRKNKNSCFPQTSNWSNFKLGHITWYHSSRY